MLNGSEYNFGDHDTKDKCRITTVTFDFGNNWRTITISPDEVRKYSWKLPYILLRENRKETALAEAARQKLVDCILKGGTQNEPLSVFGHSSVFDPNQYPRDSVVRIAGNSYLSSILAHSEEDENWSYEKGYPFNYLGVITTGIQSDSNNGIAIFAGDEEEIVSGQLVYRGIVEALLKVGEWNHVRRYVHLVKFQPILRLLDILTRHNDFPLIDSTVFQDDDFDRVDSVDILAMGKGVKGRENLKARSLTRLSLAQRPV